MSLHVSDNVITHNAKQTAKRKSRKYTVIAAGLGVVLAGGGAALAMMLVEGDGNVTAEAYQSQGLTVDQEALSKKLYPGAEADITFRVINPNPFPVKVSSVALRSGPSNVAPAGCITYVSSPLTSGTSYSIPPNQQVEVPANNNRVVTLPKAVKLSDQATTGCGFSMGIKITGTQSGS